MWKKSQTSDDNANFKVSCKITNGASNLYLVYGLELAPDHDMKVGMSVLKI